MKIAILCQEEPVFLGPFLQGVIRRQPERICAVFVAGHRTGGEKTKRWKQVWKSLQTYWLIFEPLFTLWAFFLQARFWFLGKYDPRSVAGLAEIFKIPVHHVGNPNEPEFHDLLRQVAPDAVLNQSELLLKGEVLSIPPQGFLNRHASLLPHFRGRLACFWSHFHQPPSHGITIHKVDVGVDTGDIILQHEFPEIEATWTLPRVMNHMQAEAPSLFWRAVSLLEDESFSPMKQPESDEKANKFPTLADAKAYAERMANRRSKGTATNDHGD